MTAIFDFAFGIGFNLILLLTFIISLVLAIFRKHLFWIPLILGAVFQGIPLIGLFRANSPTAGFLCGFTIVLFFVLLFICSQVYSVRSSKQPPSNNNSTRVERIELKAKDGTIIRFACSECGKGFSGWYKNCPACGKTGSMAAIDSSMIDRF